MMIGQRLRQIREEKGRSQGDLERTTGLLRCYISRVEHGCIVPSLETLNRFAAALDVPLYRLFCGEDGSPAIPEPTARRTLEELADEDGPRGSDARFLLKLRGFIGTMTDPDRAFLLDFARKLLIR
jgi:transcriptional regulator with XRE-family HTH domain